MKKLSLSILTLMLTFSVLNAQKTNNKRPENIRGGSFKDLILPMPIYDGLEFEGIWGTESVVPRDIHNGIEGKDNLWSYWGGNPLKGADGKYHIAICRWREETSHGGWGKSEVAHCVSDSPTGPYIITKTIVEKGHNPEVMKLRDGTYILHVINGVYSSSSLRGPWKLEGKITLESGKGPGSNLTGVQRSDGSFLFHTKRGDMIISNIGILGPYKMVSADNYTRYSGYPEDPVMWKSRHQYFSIYNHAIDRKSRHMRSLDGIHWQHESGEPYDINVFRYTDGTKNFWHKFERPKVLQDEQGRATHLSLAVIDVDKKEDLGNDNHSSKNMIMPLVVEKVITVLNKKTIDEKTKTVELKIEAEPGFDPISEVDVASLRLGHANMVNVGQGAKALSSKAKGKDLIITFSTEGLNMLPSDYDLKLLGRTKTDEILFGYALLPGKTNDPAALITSPISFNPENNTLISSVENYGLKKSEPCKALVYELSENGRKLMKEFKVPIIEPYGLFELTLPVVGKVDKYMRYEIVLVESGYHPDLWEKLDDSHPSITYKGNWRERSIEGENFMGSEKITGEKGASVTYTFTGTQARCYGYVDREMGSADVFVDGNFIERVNGYSPRRYDVVVYETEVLPMGEHTLELRITGEHIKGWEMVDVSIDAFSYRHSAEDL